LNRADGLSIVLVTHDAAVARRADRIVRLAAGRVDDAAEPAARRLAG
jgi:predicted ABC-type transport system involved in lysophospholipase L1 biosynthesis ATPase subunit